MDILIQMKFNVHEQKPIEDFYRKLVLEIHFHFQFDTECMTLSYVSTGSATRGCLIMGLNDA